MSSASELQYGTDYIEKMNNFKDEVNKIQKNSSEDFDVDSAFYLHTFKGNNRVNLEFRNKDLPEDVKQDIKAAFAKIWK